ncbi:hypothetical protein [Chryseobacterium indoltheticum]|uniref:Uncharacterized protein n=1 Tax=Chryseobacterium indoltheticum TaxID=254 RepID=A0A381FQE6_9FLAO|nr:hypothetical protein [Chryseobacterium indoltheticum]SUX48774.1 Uncharacterised protein [Chryseobacterium indoltheticum]
MIRILIILSLFISPSLFCQDKIDNCPHEASYLAYSLDDWYIPIKYEILENFIDLKIKKKDKVELYIRFKISENLNCEFLDANNCNLKYKVLTYDEETNSFEKRESEIEFNFVNGKGKINIQHPNFPLISSDATSVE